MSLRLIPALRDNYIWLLSDEAGQAIVIDPGEAPPVQRILDAEGLKLQAILLTHHHADHIGGVEALLATQPVPVHAPHDERIACASQHVQDGDTVNIPALDMCFEVIGIPGHTRSHVAYYGHGLLFCGDTLFSLGCGRLFEGTPAQMLTSLDRLRALPGETQVCCAHEYTQANAAFARSVDPHNIDLARRSEEVERLREAGRPTLPVPLRDECACNPFLRSDTPSIKAWAQAQGIDDDRVQRFAALRRAKDHFTA
ncbi:hydroxyacylglutathione hydrolase [Oleiagrimonas sp. MCCC 1A03011]|uniref:hydroxyacylglutathione hydrolase n=1 Tax=Oleiagrimonas sp. MCCC 1A03011 TaxID=1926883 RepID=UPI000DC3E0B7|nr:hydroxyacylglutathione hydrolase [Oleiagrimonas sp. MCCC 1A03011]RAP57617.1 hydroxyacylglutathione hydrolase [Oleiagrimonas sp. MCCC 1A03011]